MDRIPLLLGPAWKIVSQRQHFTACCNSCPLYRLLKWTVMSMKEKGWGRKRPCQGLCLVQSYLFVTLFVQLPKNGKHCLWCCCHSNKVSLAPIIQFLDTPLAKCQHHAYGKWVVIERIVDITHPAFVADSIGKTVMLRSWFLCQTNVLLFCHIWRA